MKMKKRVLCLFSLVLFLLVACTLLSLKIEEEMTTLVQVEKRTPTSPSTVYITQRALYSDEEGDHLYEIREGTGWDTGLRIYEISTWNANSGDNSASLLALRDYTFVRSSSRQPVENDPVTIVEEFETVTDTYLYCYENGLPQTLELPDGAVELGRSEQAWLLEIQEASLPFFEQTAATMNTSTRSADSVYSLTEAAQFFGELPKITLAAVILIFGLGLWLFSCILSIRAEENKGLLGFNAVLALGLLGALEYVLLTIDLPASLLPVESILDWAYYQQCFSQLFTALEAFPNTAAGLLTAQEQALGQCAAVLLLGGAVLVVFLAVQSFIVLLRSRRAKRA